ncbi:MAG: aminopeptidase, partial [Lachnospiraceae bacterium]|nr:aminopeptidase [Lachnospiraceae bacterium]
MNGKELAKELLWEAPHIAKKAPALKEAAYAFCEDYKIFLDRAKTERECVREAIRLLRAAGYEEFDRKKQYGPGDKVYWNNRGKALVASTVGTMPLEAGIRMNGAHIDSPRLDLKPNPLFEKSEIAYLKPHYYGGIRKYQWG